MILRVLLYFVLLGGCDLATQAIDTGAGNQTQFDAPPRFAGLLREPRPMLQIGIVNTGAQSRLVQESVDGPYVRYLSIDRAAVVLQHGMLHSAFGFGEGLMGADLSQSLALVRSGSVGRATRRHTYLTGEDTTRVRIFNCIVTDRGASSVETTLGTVQTQLMYETCHDEAGAPVFENQYWVDLTRGEIMLSLQWLGERFGAMSTRVIPI